MTERERLIELISSADKECKHSTSCKSCSGYGKGAMCMNYHIADHLLANGVIVPPCKVGEKVYAVDKRSCLWWQGKIIAMYFDRQFAVAFTDGEVAIYDWDSVFATKEEAEQALRKEDEGNEIK